MIDVKNLYYSYHDDEIYAVSDINFHINDGEVFGLLGSIGSGKTTIQNILCGLLPFKKGDIIIDGIDLKNPTKAYFNDIGVLFERPKLYRKFTALENLRFFSRLYSKKCEDPRELLAKVGLNNDIKKKVFDYTAGMIKRLGLARALINNPKTLLLDEPTSGIDNYSADIIKEVVFKKRDSIRSFFISTHNIQVAEKLCDRLGFIADGKIKKISTLKKLKREFGKNIIEVEYMFRGKVIKESLCPNNMAEKELLANIMRSKKIKTMHTKEATLDEIFLNLTGKELK
jgi:fluoroquinolone transport system ATP-binding protein